MADQIQLAICVQNFCNCALVLLDKPRGSHVGAADADGFLPGYCGPLFDDLGAASVAPAQQPDIKALEAGLGRCLVVQGEFQNCSNR